MTYLKTGISIFCYIFTASVLIYALILWIVIGSDTTSSEGLQLHECMDLANTVASDRDSKWLIQKGCLGNYIIHTQ